ncbi:phosphate signaling complex protein PhoU [candidate division WOR-3 bacterium]|jgi:phosphate transport system protein|nr:phosphate signaling complex protein PhoU [candidate division WOR-3 bacterium]
MDRHFDEELQKVKKDLLGMASLVEESITKSLEALKKQDIKMASEIQEIDHQIDKFEIAIEEQCIELIARHQPVGADLRFLIGVIKMNNDLERMGDHAVNIASYIAYLIEQPRIKSVSNIWSMAREVKEMLNDSVKSFMDNDATRAQKVCERDSVVDEMRDETIRILLTYMLEQPETIKSAIPLLLVAKNLERIADLSTNICEDVIYIAQARVIKHHAEEKEN